MVDKAAETLGPTFVDAYHQRLVKSRAEDADVKRAVEDDELNETEKLLAEATGAAAAPIVKGDEGGDAQKGGSGGADTDEVLASLRESIFAFQNDHEDNYEKEILAQVLIIVLGGPTTHTSVKRRHSHIVHAPNPRYMSSRPNWRPRQALSCQ